MSGSRISTIPACRIKPGTLRAPSQNYAKARVRLVGTVLTEQNDEWTEARRYMGPEILAACKKGRNTTETKREWRDSRGYWCLNRHRSRGGILIHHLLGRGPSTEDAPVRRVGRSRADGMRINSLTCILDGTNLATRMLPGEGD